MVTTLSFTANPPKEGNVKTTRTEYLPEQRMTDVELHDTATGYSRHAGFVHKDGRDDPISVETRTGWTALYADPSDDAAKVSVSDTRRMAYGPNTSVSLKLDLEQAELLRDKLNALLKVAKKDPALY